MEPLFATVGRAQVEMLTEHGMLGERVDLLDIGCGCGRMARYLPGRPCRSYRGFDRHPGMIKWCSDVLTPIDPRLRFDLVSVRSAYVAWDHHDGQQDAESLTFPYPSNTFDSILMASVLTHMPFSEVRRYLSEASRVMRPGGKILLSVFLTATLERRGDEVNFYFPPRLLASAFDEARLAVRLAPSEFGYGYTQNWYVLTSCA
jgi:SAM-dependent methyltransferase